MDAFISGSRAYGAPSKSSDIDLVIKVSCETLQKLRKLAGVADKPQEPIRFGHLNLICLTTDEDMAVWKVGTEQMVQEKLDQKKPVSRNQAIKILDGLRESIGKGKYECPSGKE